MKIVKFKDCYSEGVKDLLVELQEYVVEIDKYKLNILTKQYREKYFNKTLSEITENNGAIFVAIENNKVIGLIGGYIEKYDSFDKIIYTCPKKGIVSVLIVSNSCRHGGVGNKLLKRMEEYFKKNGCEYAQIDVFAYNQQAKSFYKKYNYEERMLTYFKPIK